MLLYFNPLSPHGERPTSAAPPPAKKRFQSTLPAWGETAAAAELTEKVVISIHSPRMGRDLRILRTKRPGHHFNPLSPHGERLTEATRRAMAEGFQSTLPAWGETKHVIVVKLGMQFQSTLPAWGETNFRIRAQRLRNFNPLSPHGERQQTHTTFRREKLAHLHNIVSFRQQRGSSC